MSRQNKVRQCIQTEDRDEEEWSQGRCDQTIQEGKCESTGKPQSHVGKHRLIEMG